MQAMFMEDDVVETTDVDDVRYNMRRALRANQVSLKDVEMSGPAAVCSSHNHMTKVDQLYEFMSTRMPGLLVVELSVGRASRLQLIAY